METPASVPRAEIPTRDFLMTTLSPSTKPRAYCKELSPASAMRAVDRSPRGVFLAGARGALLTLAGLVFVGLIAFLDHGTESHLSLSILYLLPVAGCAWCGGFSPGVLVSLAGSTAWHMVDLLENPAIPPTFRVWNGIIRFGTMVLISSLVSRLHGSMLRERFLARTDPLTGAANGRTLYETAAVEAERARRASRPLTLAYFDLDNFKQLNDQFGHAVGDEALRCFVQTLQIHLRHADLLARLGGDEFALLLPETGAEGAVALLSRLQEYLAREMERKGWPVTLSVGAVTFLRPLADVDLMIQRIDALMYSAKRKGKGRIEHAVVENRPEDAKDGKSGRERRATARALSNRTARIRREGQESELEEFAAIRDVSMSGIGLHLDRRLPDDTVLMIEPLAPEARTLLARVLHTTPEEGGWRHGCELSTRLSAEELCFWSGQPVKA
jgi:diguanylate cyclase (GGDEF)-like protein